MLLEKLFDGLYRNFGGKLVWKMKLSRGNAAKRHTFQIFLCRQLQTGAVAGSQQHPVTLCHSPIDNRPDRVQHIAAGQIKCRGDFCLPGGFWVPLLFHQFFTGKAQLHPGIGVDGVVDAAVVRAVAAGHAAVGGVDNGIAPERCNIALPKVQPRLQGH